MTTTTTKNITTFKVRFNLSKGVNYMKFQVTNNVTKKVLHFCPNEVNLVLYNCILNNQKGTAKKIFEGQSKSVVSWITCTSFEVTTNKKPNNKKVSYNPKNRPFWTNNKNENIDKTKYQVLHTFKNGIYESNFSKQLSIKF